MTPARVFATALLVLGVATPVSGAAPAEPGSPPVVSAASAIVMDARTGAVLFAQNADVRRPPASTTKVLTAILVLERLRLDQMVPISRRASEQRAGSSIGLEVGERWRVGDLLNAMMIASANDAAVALAEAAAGSVEEFAALMNEKARQVGATNSTFVVPHGLYDPRHLTTARDLAQITRYALRNPVFAALVRQQVFTWIRHGLPPRVVVNRNRLLWRLPGADGVKTGWIRQSGQCLVAAATRGNWQLIAVVLDSSDVFGESARLLEYGFAHFRLVQAVARNAVVAQVPLRRAEGPVTAAASADLYVVVPRAASLRREVRLRADLAPPISQGTLVGEVLVYAGSRIIGRVPVVAAAAVRPQPFWRDIKSWLRGSVEHPSAKEYGG